jgi:Cu/Ag efflux protein CusF
MSPYPRKQTMILLTLISLPFTALVGCGQSNGPDTAPPATEQPKAGMADEKMPDSTVASADAQTHTTRGRVTRLDPTAGRITVAHEAVPSMKWPAMTMEFQVEDKNALGAMKEGESVQFSFVERPAGQYVITQISPAN